MAVNDNARYAYRYLMEKYKLQPHQAAGIVGNLMQESSLNTGARNRGDGSDGSDSIGIAQWNGQRARNLKAFGGGSYNTLDTQLDFVMHEMNGEGGKYGAGSERAAYQRLMNSKDVGGATSAFIGFERPQGWSADNPTGGHGYKNRLNYAGLVSGMSPEEIAQAQPTSAQLQVDQGTKDAVAAATTPDDRSIGQKIYDRFLGTETAEQAKASIIPKVLPEEFMGVNTKKGINLLGALGTSMTESTDKINQQLQQSAQAGQQRRASAQPVEIALMSSNPAVKQEVQGGISSLAQLPPQELQELLKKRLGGLGGLGGWRV